MRIINKINLFNARDNHPNIFFYKWIMWDNYIRIKLLLHNTKVTIFIGLKLLYPVTSHDFNGYKTNTFVM